MGFFKTSSQHSRLRHRGFNLIESAIVLGIVGLVIGGIWVTASWVREELGINRTVSDIGSIMAAIQSKGGPQYWRADSTGVWIGDTLQLVPGGYSRHSVPATYPDYYYNPNVAGTTLSLAIISNGSLAQIYINGLPSGTNNIDVAKCIKLSTGLYRMISGKGADTNYLVQVTGALIAMSSTFYPNTADVPNGIATQCRTYQGARSIRLVFPT